MWYNAADNLCPEGILKAVQLDCAVRPGHYLSLDYMDTPEFLRVKVLFEGTPEIGGVYFRPTDKRITVVDTHPESLKPLIGVGKNPYISCGKTAEQLVTTMDERVCYLHEARNSIKHPWRERQFEARMIREAQGNRLRLPGCPDHLCFIHSQWRMDPTSGGSPQITDLLAVDVVRRGLVLLELKPKRDDSAFAQVQGYVEYFYRHWDNLGPFFTRVAQVMGKLYGCRELASIGGLSQEITALVIWPGTNGELVVKNA